MVQKLADTLYSSLTEKDEYIRPSEELIKDLKNTLMLKILINLQKKNSIPYQKSLERKSLIRFIVVTVV
jgi:hypothetical protein